MNVYLNKNQQKQLIALLTLVLFGLSGLFIGFQVSPQVNNTDKAIFPATTTSTAIPTKIPSQAQGQGGFINQPITDRMNPPLYEYYTTGHVPMMVRTYNGKVGVLVYTMAGTDLQALSNYMDVFWSADIGFMSVITGTIDNNKVINDIFSLPGIIMMKADTFANENVAKLYKTAKSVNGKEFFSALDNGMISYAMSEKNTEFVLDAQNGGVETNQYFANIEMGGFTYSNQYNGTGVTIAIVDTGTDFGHSDLSGALALDHGLPLTVDPGAWGIGLTGLILDSVGRIHMDSPPANEVMIYIPPGSYISLQDLIDTYDIPFPGISTTTPDHWELPPVESKSGKYLFGVLAEPVGSAAVSSVQYTFFLLVDSQIPNRYDTLYIDFETSAAINWFIGVSEGIIDPNDVQLGVIPDYSFANEKAYTWTASNNPTDFVLAKDLNGDNINDFSAGSLSVVFDFEGITNSPIIQGIAIDGSAIGVYHDADAHGTWTASSAGSRGIVPYLYYAGVTPGTMPGTAVGAEIAAGRYFSNFDMLGNYLYLLGFDLVYNPLLDTWHWIYDPDREAADILSNSWGLTNELTRALTGFDPDGLFIDLLSLPGVADPNFPGALFVFSQGNDGNGFGNSPAPGPHLALSVGASTLWDYRFIFGQLGPRNGHLADFSSAGPNDLGVSTPDVLAPGEFAFSASPVWFQIDTFLYGSASPFPDGFYSYDIWSGTSLSAPLAAGAAAIAWQIMMTNEPGGVVNPLMVKVALMNAARERGLSPSLQGTGIINITAVVELLLDYYGVADYGDYFLAFNEDSYRLAYEATKAWRDALFGTDNEYEKSFFEDYPSNVYPEDFDATTSFATLPAGHVYGGILHPGDVYSTNISLFGNVASLTAKGQYVQRTGMIEKKWNVTTGGIRAALNLTDFLTSTELAQFLGADAVLVQFADPSGKLATTADPVFGLRGTWMRVFDWFNDTDLDGNVDLSESYFVQQNLAIDKAHTELFISKPSEAFKYDPALVLYMNALAVNNSELIVRIETYSIATWNALTVTNVVTNPSNATYEVNITAPTQPGYYEGFVTFTNQFGNYSVFMPVSFMVTAELNAFNTTVPLATTTTDNDALFRHTVAWIDGSDGSRVSFVFDLTYNHTANNKTPMLKIRLEQDNKNDSYELVLAEMTTGKLLFTYDGGATSPDGKSTDWFINYLQFSVPMQRYLVFVRATNLADGYGRFNLSVSLEDPVPTPDEVTIDFETGDFYHQLIGADVTLSANFTGRDAIENRGRNVLGFDFIVNVPTPPITYEGKFEKAPKADTSIDAWVAQDLAAGNIVNFRGGDPDDTIDFDIFVFAPSSGVNNQTYDIGSDVPASKALTSSATSASIESGSFIAPESGTYWFVIDQWESGGDLDWFLELIISAPIEFTDNGAGDVANNTTDTIIIDPETSHIPDGPLVLEAYVTVDYAFSGYGRDPGTGVVFLQDVPGYFYDTDHVTLDWQLPAIFTEISMTTDGKTINRPASVSLYEDSTASITFTAADPNKGDLFNFTLTLDSFLEEGSNESQDIGNVLKEATALTSGSSVSYDFNITKLVNDHGYGTFIISATVEDYGPGGSGDVSTYLFLLTITKTPPPPPTSTTTTSGEGGIIPGFELLPVIVMFSIVVPVILSRKRR